MNQCPFIFWCAWELGGVFIGMDFYKQTFEYDKILNFLAHAYRMSATRGSKVKKVPVGDNKVWLRDMVREVKTFERALDATPVSNVGMRDGEKFTGRTLWELIGLKVQLVLWFSVCFFPRFGSVTLPSKDVDGPEKEDFGDLVPSLCEERWEHLYTCSLIIYITVMHLSKAQAPEGETHKSTYNVTILYNAYK